MSERRCTYALAALGVVALTVLNVFLIVNRATNAAWMIPQTALVIVTLGLMWRAAML